MPAPRHPHEAQQPQPLDVGRDEPQEQEGMSMADLQQALRRAARGADRRAGARASRSRQRAAPTEVKPKLDAQGRAYATGKRKNAVARVWIKPGTGKITVNGRDSPVYFARPVLRMMINQPFVVANRLGPVRRRLHRRSAAGSPARRARCATASARR